MLDFSFDTFPVLKTERLILRRITPQDADVIYKLRSDERVVKYLDSPPAKSVKDALKIVNIYEQTFLNNFGITWGITLKDDDRLLGNVGFLNVLKAHYRAAIGYILDPQMHGKGIMSEAFSAMLDYGFAVMKLHSVEADVNPANHASIKLLERMCFVRESYHRENYYYDGKFIDSAIYARLTPYR